MTYFIPVKNYLQSVAAKYRVCFADKNFRYSLILAVLLLVFSAIVNFYAGIYATEKASNPVTDIILDNIPVFDVDFLFLYGPLFFWIFLVAPFCFSEPRRLPFVIKSIALLVLVRSVFITLTHIGPFPDKLQLQYTWSIFSKFTFGGDLFFSGHTGLPFLMAMVFKNHKFLFYLYTASAIFFGAIVLMAHQHYSIDVLSAFFITFAIYHMTLYFFKEDKKVFDGEYIKTL